MSLTIPHIVERLPTHRDRILKARFQTDLVDELCRDYDTVAAALDAEHSARHRQELQLLARQLEQEMLDWLSAHGDGTFER